MFPCEALIRILQSVQSNPSLNLASHWYFLTNVDNKLPLVVASRVLVTHAAFCLPDYVVKLLKRHTRTQTHKERSQNVPTH